MSIRAVVFFGLLLAVALIFTLFPQVDQSVSGLFYRSGGGFFLYANPIIRTINGVVPPLAVGSGIVLATILAWTGWTKRPVAGLSWRAAAYLLAVLLVAPGLLANTALKDHWGRARPSHTVTFGATLTLANDGEWLWAGLNIGLSVALCLFGVWLGHAGAMLLNQ